MPESSPDRGQQSLNLGTFPEPLSPAWPEVFAGVSQATANLGGISIISSGEGEIQGNPIAMIAADHPDATSC